MGGLAVPPVGLSFCLDPNRGTPSRKNPVEDLLNDLRGHWAVAVSHQPLTQANANEALNIARDILSVIPLATAAK